MSPDKLQGSTIVVTGVTGQVARPLATALARDNRVIGAARFSDATARTELEAAGVECVPVDLVSGDVGQLPADADYVLHFAVAKTNDWEKDLAANSGGLASLMEHHRGARAFLHCSSTAVYKPDGHRVFDEEGPLGDNHGVWPFLRTYSICKIAAEGTARGAAQRFELPTTIARLSVPYGDSGGLAYLMEHHRQARAFLHCSSTAVYKPEGHRVFDEQGPLGDNHGVWPFLRTYSICKIAAEGTARWAAERFELPTTIARLSVPYGDNGGWPAIHLHMMLSGHAIPVHVDAPSIYHPLHADDILAMVPRLLAAASVPAVTVNWGGSEAVSIEEWCTYLAGLAGTEARFEPTAQTIDSVQIDTTRMHELAGTTTVPWRDGMRRMAKALHPDRVQ